LPKVSEEEDDASEDVDSAGGGGVAAAPPPDELELPPPNPQPDLPFVLATSNPEQIPMEPRVAQQALGAGAQSASLKHWPLMNC